MRAIKARGDVAVDLSELSWADASLMLDFVMLARRLRAQQRTISLRGAQPQIAALIELIGLDRLPGVRFEGPAVGPQAAVSTPRAPALA